MYYLPFFSSLIPSSLSFVCSNLLSNLHTRFWPIFLSFYSSRHIPYYKIQLESITQIKMPLNFKDSNYYLIYTILGFFLFCFFVFCFWLFLFLFCFLCFVGFFVLFLFLFLFLRDRAWMGGRKRGRERENFKQALQPAWNLRQDFISRLWDHDLSPNQVLDA